jgi:hypothetical protein
VEDISQELQLRLRGLSISTMGEDSVPSNFINVNDIDDLTEASQAVSWQEEAHWMSFRHAVLAVASRRRHRGSMQQLEAPDGDHEVTSSSINEKTTACLESPKGTHDFEDENDSVNDESSLADLVADLFSCTEAATPCITSDPKDAKKCGNQSSIDYEKQKQKLEETNVRLARAEAERDVLEEGGNDTLEHHQQQKRLAETPRKLAIMQAERDALEVALLHSR